jgi:hypothetical protein
MTEPLAPEPFGTVEDLYRVHDLASEAVVHAALVALG